MDESLWPALAGLAYAALHVGFIIRALLRRHREPTSRLAWVVVIVGAPVIGMIAYLFFGETNIGRRRFERLRAVKATLPEPVELGPQPASTSIAHDAAFAMGRSVNGYPPVAGNSAVLLASSDATIDAMVADIDAATRNVHIMFYIWLADTNGLKVVDAIVRAAGRGVACRIMADDLGSRALIKSAHWRRMRDAGATLVRAMPIGNVLIKPFRGRIDMRNHRKIVVIDNRITYCGSQNCADPAFLPKARFAPWVDAVMRFEGPVVRQNQHLFLTDWMSSVDEDISDLLREPLEPSDGFIAQVIGTGAEVRNSAMPDVFVTLIEAAHRELTITTPYYVPDEAIQAALCSAGWRGVRVRIVFPARNDSWIVAAASRSYYEDLLDAGVEIYEYVGGLLHTKSMVVDGELSLIGSANMDRRSFELNFENNILFADKALTADFGARQQTYLDASRRVEAQEVGRWSRRRRLWNNVVAMLGPVL